MIGVIAWPRSSDGEIRSRWRRRGLSILADERCDPRPLDSIAEMSEIAPRPSFGRRRDLEKVDIVQMHRVEAEDLMAIGGRRHREFDRFREATARGGIEIARTVRCSDDGARAGSDHSVDLSQQYGEQAASRFVHLLVPCRGKRIDLIQKEDARARLRGHVENASQLPLRFAVPLRHDAFDRDVDERQLCLCGDRARVVVSANAAMVVLYWEIGRLILERQSESGWGAKVIEE